MAGIGGWKRGEQRFALHWNTQPWGRGHVKPVKRTPCPDCGLSFERVDMHRCVLRGDAGRRYARRPAQG